MRTLLAAICVATIACSDAGARGAVEQRTVCESSETSGRPYPRCPYSETAELGGVLPNKEFAGRLAGQSSAWRTIDFADIHAMRNEGKRLLVFNVAALWCGPCRAEAREFEDKIVPRYSPRGVAFLSVVLQDLYGQPATDRHVDSWVSSFPLTYPVVRDVEGWSAKIFNSQTMPFNMIVDLTTMRVEFRTIGADVSRVTAKLDELLEK